MKVTLTKMQIHHFGIIQDETIDFLNTENTIELPNGSGKTTRSDAFSWVIYGKDSFGNTRFNFTPTNIENPTPNVIVWLDVDGTEIELEKSVGKWKYNKLEVSKTVFEDFIKNIYDVATLELLSNPMAFMNLHWETQRNFLTGLFCPKVDEKSEFAFLMKSMSISDIRKSKTQQKKLASDGLKRCGIIIEEHQKSLFEALKNDFVGLKFQLEQKQSQLLRLSNFDWKNYYNKEARLNTLKKEDADAIAAYKFDDNCRTTEEHSKLENAKDCRTCGSKITQAAFDKSKLTNLEYFNQKLTTIKADILSRREKITILKAEFAILHESKPDDTVPAVLAEIQKGVDYLKIQIAKENDIVLINVKIQDQQTKLDNFTDEVMQIEKFMDRFATFLTDNYFKSINDNFEGLFFDIENECKLTNAIGTEYKRFSLSEKINTGVQIIAALSKKIDLQFPIWIDNRESVSALYNIDTQIINLKVKN
jgi:hypothetical protein